VIVEPCVSGGRILRGLLLVSLLAVGCSAAPPPTSAAAAPLEALRPSGPTRWPFSFTWQGVAPDGVARVRVFDEAERQIYGIEARGNQVEAPAELRRVLGSGTTYLWRVSRLDENGDEVGESALQLFTLADGT
jgi:hypothetical protein